MMFINIVARILFYMTAWCATDPVNTSYLLDQEDTVTSDSDEEATGEQTADESSVDGESADGEGAEGENADGESADAKAGKA